MKNSAWYHKLWLKKLSELPLKEDADSAWAGMKDVLDKQLPVSSSAGHGGSAGSSAAKPFIAKLVSLVGYALPVAAAIGVTTYFVAPLVIKPKQADLRKKQELHLHADTVHSKLTDSLKDTTAVKVLNDTVSTAADLEAGLTPDKGLLPADKTANETIINKKNHSTDVRIISRTGTQNGSYLSAIVKANATAKTKNTEVYRTSGKPFNSSSSTSPLTAASVSAIESGAAGKKDNLVNPAPGSQATNQKGSLTQEKVTEQLTVNKPEKASPKNKAAASKSSKNSKAQKVKTSKKTDITTPPYDFGLEAGLNTGKSSSLYLGFFGSYRIRTRLLLNAGIRINTSTALTGSYTSKPYSVPGDSTSHQYKVSDTRKIMMLNIPLTIEYRISGRISVNAGPVISFPLGQTNIKTVSELLSGPGPFNLRADTLRKRSVDSTLTHTTLNKINLGITGGVSIRIKQFYIEAKYLQNLSPYKVNSSLGGYQQSYKSVQLGIRYKFKK